MNSRHRKCYKLFKLMLFALFLCIPPHHTVLSLAPTPVDYLIPPPPPLPQSSATITRLNNARTKNLLATESRILPQYISSATLTKPIDQQQQAQQQQHPGFMTRVARWFGFANQNLAQDQQVAAASTNQQAAAYYYPKPQQQGAGDKEPCNLCNKYPWVPMMMPNGIHYPVAGNQWDPAKQHQANNLNNNGQLQNLYGPPQQGQPQQLLKNSYGIPLNQQQYNGQHQPQLQHAASNIKQRAVQFNFPHPNNYEQVPPNKVKDALNPIQYSTGPFLPIPLPNLNNHPMPPLYNAQPFQAPITPLPQTIQQLPSTEPAHFAENIGQHSEIHVDTVIPTQIPPTTQIKDTSFEIIKSHQLVDYVSSIEYPASFVQTQTFDVSSKVPVLAHKPEDEISTGNYQHSTFSPYLSQHVPASQILTEPGSFRVGDQQQSTLHSEIYEQTTTFQQPQYLEHVQHPHYEYDNYVAASQPNSTVYEQQPQTNLDTWTLESNDYLYATSTPDQTYSTESETSTLTTELDSTTTTEQPQQQDNEVEFVASIQTDHQQHKLESTKLWPQRNKQRETPKRLLDSPIQHIYGNLGSPRPFTRDPSDLGFRLGAKNHKFTETLQGTSTHEPWKPQTQSPASPTPTSTYSSLDASGQYAGMSPPALPVSSNKQVVIPYLTTKNRPRPFETTRDNSVTKSPAATSAFSTWTQNQSVELHTPQESMLVRSHIRPDTTTTTTSKPRTTKYLTKILASNLRELLQREHQPLQKLKLSPNSLDIDINKLQKNIDDWTEQEYTSLSHRPSTPTIRGRSKHIPSEYLPTTTVAVKSTRQSKTTKGFVDSSELPSSINNLEPLYERGSTKHFQYTHITDNHLQDFYDNFEALKARTTLKPTTTMTTRKAFTTTITTRALPSTTMSTTTKKPLYLRPILELQEPEELWKKAKVSISPQTQEKVYVVTPQPRFFPQRLYSATVPTTTEKSLNFMGSGFKSPRFLVRPTPGNDTNSKENSKERLNNAYFSPEWFGLRGLSTYVPAEPVEINDGNSKVLTIVTAPSNFETTTSHNIMDLTKERHMSHNNRKSTMKPSPR